MLRPKRNFAGLSVRNLVPSLGSVCCCVVFSTVGVAGPSDHAPETPLEPIGIVPGSKELVISMTKLAHQIEKELVSWDDPKKLNSVAAAQRLGELRGMMIDGYDGTLLLTEMSEPASVNFARAFEAYWEEGKRLTRQAGMSERARSYCDKIFEQIKRDTDKRLELGKTCVELAEKGKVEEAFKQIQDEARKTYTQTGYFASSACAPFTEGFLANERLVREEYKKLLRKRYAENYADYLKTEADRIAAFQDKLPQVVDAIFAGGEAATVDSIAGGHDKVIAGWESTVAATARYRTIQSLLSQYGRGDVPDAPLNDDALTSLAVTAIAGMLTRSVESVPKDQIPSLYNSALVRLAGLRTRTAAASGPDGSIEELRPTALKPCSDALQALAAADAKLQQRVVAYHAATDELLRWRKRQTKQWIEARQSADPEAGSWLAGMSVATATIRPEMFGKLSPIETMNASPGMLPLVHWQVSESASKLLGKRVSLFHSFPISRGNADPSKAALAITWIAPHAASGGTEGAYHYGLMTIPPWETKGRQAFEAELLVDDESRPLSLVAADAVECLRNGTRLAAGGPISGIAMEPLLSRLGSMPRSAAVLLPINTPVYSAQSMCGKSSSALERFLLWRLVVKPDWMASEFAYAGK